MNSIAAAPIPAASGGKCQRPVGRDLLALSMLTSYACLVLHLIDECSLNDHHRCHYSDHREKLSCLISICHSETLEVGFHSPMGDDPSDRSRTRE